MQIETNNTLALVCRYIKDAEDEARKTIKEILPGADEEEITQQFQTDLHRLLLHASENGEIERAFQLDIDSTGLSNFEVNSAEIASGLIAEVSWHPKHVEKKQAGILA